LTISQGKVAAQNRLGGKIKDLSMAYTLSNKCAKNLCRRTVLLQLIIKNVVSGHKFFWNTVYVGHNVCRPQS